MILSNTCLPFKDLVGTVKMKMHPFVTEIKIKVQKNRREQMYFTYVNRETGLSCGSDGIESTCNAGEPGLIPGSGRSPGEGNGYPFQYSCLKNPMDRGA